MHYFKKLINIFQIKIIGFFEKLKNSNLFNHLYYHIDRISYTTQLFTFSGWAFSTFKSIKSVKIIVIDGKNKKEIDMEYFHPRFDVYQVYQNKNSKLSGFFLSAKVQFDNPKNLKYELLITFEDGSIKKILRIGISYNIKLSKKNFIKLIDILKLILNKNKGILKSIRTLIAILLSHQLELYVKYFKNIIENEPGKKDLLKQKKDTFKYSPKISIVVPTYNTPEKLLKEMIRSVKNQTYSNWELCIADGSDKNNIVRKLLKAYVRKDKRIKLKLLDRNKGIAANSNEAILLSHGDYLGFLDHDDLLQPHALYEVVKCVEKNRDADLIYSDEDKISEDGILRSLPCFKPDFSPDTLRSYNYICHFTVIRKEIGDKLGWFRDGFNGAQDYDLILRVSEETSRIIHIPKILYHWRLIKSSTALNPDSKKYAFESGTKALVEHLKRNGVKWETISNKIIGTYQIKYELDKNHLISIIIPNKDEVKTLKRCVNSITQKSSYQNYEIIIIENNSRKEETFQLYNQLKKNNKIRVIKRNKPFNYSEVNNFAAQEAKGDILLFLNNDTEVRNSDWLERMLEHAERKVVGAVGAKLYYPDNTIQHGGIIIGIGGAAGHSHKLYKGEDYGYCARLAVIQNLSAVTGACLMMRKNLFQELGGFDENYKLSFNDVDLCLKIRSKGYLIVWTPFAELYHHESKTRGYEDTQEKVERFESERALLSQRWAEILNNGDPYYNINLTLVKEDFSLK